MGITIIENEMEDGSYELNTYNEHEKLIKSEIHHSNGLIETEQFKDDDKVSPKERAKRILDRNGCKFISMASETTVLWQNRSGIVRSDDIDNLANVVEAWNV